MMKSFLATATAAALALGSFVGAAQAEDPLKVGVVYVGPIGDHGWTYRHDLGRQAIEEAFGDQVETTYVESVSEGPDAVRVIRQLAASGHGLIFTTSFGFMDPTIEVAEQFPDVKFEHATGYKRADNVSTYSARFYEGRYILGRIAGQMTEAKKIGYIGSVPIPEVVRGINAFTLGLQREVPDASVSVVWVNSWYDPAKEADAAKALIAQGADILVQHTDSPAALQVSQTEGIKAFGQASDMNQFAPDTQMTAIVDNWDAYYVDRTQAVLDGTWESTDTWDGIDPGMVYMAPYTNMPYEVAAMAKAQEEAIRLGRFDIFTGPISDRDGNLQIPEGETADDGMLLGMNWFVPGVEGDLPK